MAPSRAHYTLLLLFSSYLMLQFCRRNFGLWMPTVMEKLGKDKAAAGVVHSSFELVFGAGKLFGGPLVDVVSPSRVLVASLAASAAANLGIAAITEAAAAGGSDGVAASAAVPLLALLWGVNGLVQSIGWPAMCKIFMQWFTPDMNRGAWYSVMATSQNFGAGLAPLIATAAVAVGGGWAGALLLPAALSAATALLLFVQLRDRPGTLASAAAPAAAPARAAAAAAGAPPPTMPAAGGGGGGGGALSILLHHVLLNRAMLLLALSYACVSFARAALIDWAPLMLREEKAASPAAIAAAISVFEAGGLAGSLLFGALSDSYFGGRLGPAMAITTAALAAACVGWVALPRFPAAAAPSSVLEWLPLLLVYVVLGAGSFTPHVLAGLASRELAPPQATETAGGFVKAIAQVGAVAAGYPLGVLTQTFGWAVSMSVVAAAAAAGALLIVPLWWVTPAPPPSKGAAAGRAAVISPAATGAAARSKRA